MAVSEQNLKALTQAFESLFEDQKTLGQMFLENNTQEYAECVKDVLTQEGFLGNANYQNVAHDYAIDYGLLDPPEWAEKMIEDNYLDNEGVEVVKDKPDELTTFIFDNYDQLDHYISLYDEPAEWGDENPCVEYLEMALRSQFYPDECAELIPTHDTEYYLESVREAMGDDFPEDTDILELDVNIFDIELITDTGTLAEAYIDDAIHEGSVDRFIQNKYHIALVEDGYIKYAVEVLSDPEDFQEE